MATDSLLIYVYCSKSKQKQFHVRDLYKIPESTKNHQLWACISCILYLGLINKQTLGGMASICFRIHFQQALRIYRSRGLRGVKRSEKLWKIKNYQLPGRPFTHHWVKSKTICQFLRKGRIILPTAGGVLPDFWVPMR